MRMPTSALCGALLQMAVKLLVLLSHGTDFLFCLFDNFLCFRHFGFGDPLGFFLQMQNVSIV